MNQSGQSPTAGLAVRSPPELMGKRRHDTCQDRDPEHVRRSHENCVERAEGHEKLTAGAAACVKQ